MGGRASRPRHVIGPSQRARRAGVPQIGDAVRINLVVRSRLDDGSSPAYPREPGRLGEFNIERLSGARRRLENDDGRAVRYVTTGDARVLRSRSRAVDPFHFLQGSKYNAAVRCRLLTRRR